MARFNASARRIAALNRLERDAVDEAKLVLADRKPLIAAPDLAYMPAARSAVIVLEVFANRIRHVENGAAS